VPTVIKHFQFHLIILLIQLDGEAMARKIDNCYECGHAWSYRMHSGIKWDLFRRALFRKPLL